jgi:hypothetical protein
MCSLLTRTYRGRYTDTGSVEDDQLSSEMQSSEYKTMKISMAELVEEGMVEAWQRRWDVSQRKAHVHLLSTSSRLRWSWQQLSHTDGHRPQGIQEETAQPETGRGPSVWLPSRGSESPEHILYECTKYNSNRDQLWECVLIE